MMTVTRAFQQFLETLELHPKERTDASDQHKYMREQLQQRMEVEDNFLSGSYARSTAIRPLNDIDIFLVLRATDDVNQSMTPTSILKRVKSTLKAIYPGKAVKLQSRSVNIEFSRTGIAYDVVPGFSHGTNIYRIPDRDAPRWISTNPKVHKELSVDANKRAGGKLKRLVKAVKHASNVHEAGARSFHLEVLSWSILTSPPDTFLEGLTTLLNGLAAKVCDSCPDPAGLGPDIQPSPEKCLEAKTWLDKMAELARDAASSAKLGHTGEAHACLYELLGNEWPEVGSKRKSGTGVIIGGSVDHSGSRFG